MYIVAFLLQIIKEGNESEGQRPKRSDICKISYEVKIRDTGELVEKRDQVKIYLGDNEVSLLNLCKHVYKIGQNGLKPPNVKCTKTKLCK